jgi:hypothetical protein
MTDGNGGLGQVDAGGACGLVDGTGLGSRGTTRENKVGQPLPIVLLQGEATMRGRGGARGLNQREFSQGRWAGIPTL